MFTPSRKDARKERNFDRMNRMEQDEFHFHLLIFQLSSIPYQLFPGVFAS